MNSGGGTGAAGAGFVNVKGGKLVKGEESQPIRSLVLLKKGGGMHKDRVWLRIVMTTC